MTSITRTSETGAALVTALIISVMLFGIAGSYLILSAGGYENSAREMATAEARLAAEDGIQLSIAEIKSGVDADADGLGFLTSTAADGRTIETEVTALGGNLYRIHSEATLRRARKAADVVVERVPNGVVNANSMGAIMSKGAVQTLGTIVIDGRDWNALGTTIVGSGIYGIVSEKTISNGGNSKVGGNGVAPAKPPPATTIQANSSFTDGKDNDNDGVQNEELFDGIDNDGDGEVDEDTQGFPTTPDVAMHLPANALKNAAIASGTYFTNSLQVTACIALNGGKMPGGKIIFCDFATWQPVNFGSAYNTTPSILVHHVAGSAAVMKNVTGYFKGLLICDGIEHFTGTFKLLGAAMCFSDQAIGNALGLGNADILYSSAVLANLPTVGNAAQVRIKSWCRSAVD